MKPSINAGMDELRRESNRGADMGRAPGSAGNVMPGPDATRGSGVRVPSGGATAPVKGIPSRMGAAPAAMGTYKNQPGSPAGGMHQVTPGTVPPSTLGGASKARDAMLAHGRVLAGVSAIRAVHGDHPHLSMAHSKSSAHIAGYKNKMKNSDRAAGPKFGALGGSTVPGAGPQAPGMAPLGMAKLPDEM